MQQSLRQRHQHKQGAHCTCISHCHPTASITSPPTYVFTYPSCLFLASAAARASSHALACAASRSRLLSSWRSASRSAPTSRVRLRTCTANVRRTIANGEEIIKVQAVAETAHWQCNAAAGDDGVGGSCRCLLSVPAGGSPGSLGKPLRILHANFWLSYAHQRKQRLLAQPVVARSGWHCLPELAAWPPFI